MNSQTKSPLPPKTSWAVWFFRWALMGVTGVVLLAIAFYSIENSRGRRAWENCRRELEAKGEQLHWSAFIPAAISDDKNILAAPRMSEWFVGRDRNEIITRLAFTNLVEFGHGRAHTTKPMTVAEIRIVQSNSDLNVQDGDTPLYHFGQHQILCIRRPTAQTNQTTAISCSGEVLPEIMFDEALLSDVIKNLVRLTGRRYEVAPDAARQIVSSSKQTISLVLKNVTASQALLDVLNHYNLQWVEAGKSSIGRIELKDPTVTQIPGYPKVQEEIERVIRYALNSGATTVAQGMVLTANPDRVKPAQITMIRKTEKTLTDQDILEILPTNAFGLPAPAISRFRVESTESKTFRILLDASQIYTPQEFLEWSNQFQSEFDRIREALKRPLSSMAGNFSEPWLVPTPNYKSFRALAEMLAQRAQSHLLLKQPQDAVRELKLLWQMFRILESKPITLVSAMTETALVECYVDVVRNGIRLNSWQEPQLLAIQEELSEINLPSLLATALRYERVYGLRMMNVAFDASGQTGLANQLQTTYKAARDLGMPHGWFDQNLATLARLAQKSIDSIDPTNRSISVEQVKAWHADERSMIAEFRPYTFFAGSILFNRVGSFRTVARIQTLTHEAIIACALEGFRIKNGPYPAALGSLSPALVQKLPRDPIGGSPMKYRRLSEDKFLLYSIGWDNHDDGGVSEKDSVLGDWVWSNN